MTVTCPHLVRHQPAAKAARVVRTPQPLLAALRVWHVGGFTSFTGDGGFSSALPSNDSSKLGIGLSLFMLSALLRGSLGLYAAEHGDKAPCIHCCSLSHPVRVPNCTTDSTCSTAMVVLRMIRRFARLCASTPPGFGLPPSCECATANVSARSDVHLDRWYLSRKCNVKQTFVLEQAAS
jgi:hypothetical protein